ncbi:uncharacterized protein LOC131435095 isoform X2 [Malaya genurostris]|uniref:uncharacterized protein LOC131435095 isoform X2 n=1 Tax=Malaya genurostris TaxID=325434 RepID=UPI0026F3FA6E|nr:uncharacterized protein LOC131435095 isoform X2 [Malaya genurostris]
MQTSIEYLPVEMLEQIFSYLELEDRKSVSRVCRLWAKLVFRKSNIQLALDFRAPSKLDSSESFRVLMASQRRYKHLLLYFGTKHDKSDLMLAILCKFAESLETLKLISDCTFSLRLDFFRRIVDRCQRLTTLHLQSVIFNHHKADDLRFGVLPKLERFYLKSNLLELAEVDVAKITPNITSLFIRVNYTSQRPVDFVRCFASQLTQLGICFQTADYFRQFSRLHFPRLEKFDLSSAEELVDEGEYEHEYLDLIRRLDKLKQIKLQNTVNTVVLITLTQCCLHLQDLCLNTDDLTDEHFLCFGELKCLKNLRLIKAAIDITQPEIYPVLPGVGRLTIEAVKIKNYNKFNYFLRHSFPRLVSLQLLQLFSPVRFKCDMISIYHQILNNLISLERLALHEKGKLHCEFFSAFATLIGLRELQLRFRGLGEYRYSTDMADFQVRSLLVDFRQINVGGLDTLIRIFPNLKRMEVCGASPEDVQFVRRKLPGCVVRHKRKQRIVECTNDT